MIRDILGPTCHQFFKDGMKYSTGLHDPSVSPPTGPTASMEEVNYKENLYKTLKIILPELPSGNWFCTTDCRILHSILEKLVASGPEKIPDHLMGPIRRIPKGSNANGIRTRIPNSDVKWIVVRGKDFPDENNRVLLAQVVGCIIEIRDRDSTN
ncbi:hypothetical protein LXL04_005083 [Taraxacum kok-saghyz]